MDNLDQKKEQLSYYDQGSNDYEKKRGLLSRGLNRASIRKASIIAKYLSTPVDKILEIGAGSGLVSYSLADKLKYKKYFLMDLSEQMLETAKTRLHSYEKIEYCCDDAEQMNFADNQFDAIIGVDVIHHLANPTAAMKEWLRISKPAAKLVFLETNAFNPLIMMNIGVEHEVRCFLNTDSNLKKWLENGGWSNVMVRPAPSFTPPCPDWLSPFFNFIDFVACEIP